MNVLDDVEAFYLVGNLPGDLEQPGLADVAFFSCHRVLRPLDLDGAAVSRFWLGVEEEWPPFS